MHIFIYLGKTYKVYILIIHYNIFKMLMFTLFTFYVYYDYIMESMYVRVI